MEENKVILVDNIEEPRIMKKYSLSRYSHLATSLMYQPLDSKSDKTPKNLKNAKAIEVRNEPKVHRNDKCPCGSGLKYKKCCSK
jgi:uncharacterized protein YecA (UPF0149 family)